MELLTSTPHLYLRKEVAQKNSQIDNDTKSALDKIFVELSTNSSENKQKNTLQFPDSWYSAIFIEKLKNLSFKLQQQFSGIFPLDQRKRKLNV